MKRSLVLFFTILTLSPFKAFSFDEWQLCMDKAFGDHDERRVLAYQLFKVEHEECTGTEEEKSCFDQAHTHLKEQLERSNSILQQNKRGCMKMPWAY
jgi:hypothetical protein